MIIHNIIKILNIFKKHHIYVKMVFQNMNVKNFRNVFLNKVEIIIQNNVMKNGQYIQIIIGENLKKHMIQISKV